MRALQQLWNDEQGQGLVEYVLIIALVAIGLTAVMIIFRNAIGNIFNEIANTLNTSGTTSPFTP